MQKLKTLVALLAVTTMTAAWNSLPMTADDGKIRLNSLEPAEGYQLYHNLHDGIDYYQEYRWWGWDDGEYYIEASFWNTDKPGYWHSNAIHKARFLREFGSLRDISKGDLGVEKGPTIETVLGDVETVEFDYDIRTYGEPLRQCIGFRFFWDRSRQTYAKILDFYACGKGGNGSGERMTEDQFVDLLRGLSVKGEFDSLIER